MNLEISENMALDLFLAAVPVPLGYVLGWALGAGGRKGGLPPLLALPLAVVWLAFLPNACYLLTEWRHFLFDERWQHLLLRGGEDRRAMLAAAKWALLFLAFSGAGVLAFTLAIRPVERGLLARRRTPWLLAPPFFFLVSLGVYLGLIVRLNSWDLFQRPLAVWEAADDVIFNPERLATVAVFAAILWMLYEAVDLWVDGVADRLRRLGLGRPGREAG